MNEAMNEAIEKAINFDIEVRSVNLNDVSVSSMFMYQDVTVTLRAEDIKELIGKIEEKCKYIDSEIKSI